MKKFKRNKPDKYKRSIPLRSPRNVAWYRYGTDQGKLNGKRPNPVDPPTDRCFTNSTVPQVKPAKDAPKFNVLPTPGRDYLQRRMFFFEGKYWFVDWYIHHSIAWKSKIYHDRREALNAHEWETIVWLDNFPYAGDYQD